MSDRPRCLFMARVADPSVLELIEFYREDLLALRSLGYELDVCTRNRDAMRARRPDLAYCWWHSTCLPTVLAMRLRGVPVVTIGAFHFQDTNDHSLRTSLRKAFVTLTARLSTTNIAISSVEGQDLAFLPMHRRDVVPLSVDTEFYSPGTRLPSGSNAITIAQLNPLSINRKGVDLAIQAVATVRKRWPEFRLHVVGPLTDEGQRLMDDLLAGASGDAVIVHGEVTRERKLDLLRSSSMYLQMSSFEGFGLAAVEALACGVPVVHSGVGSLPEVVGDGGVEVLDRTAMSLAAAISELLGDIEQLTRLRAAARSHAESFGRAQRAQRLQRVFAKIGIGPAESSGP